MRGRMKGREHKKAKHLIVASNVESPSKYGDPRSGSSVKLPALKAPLPLTDPRRPCPRLQIFILQSIPEQAAHIC